MSLKTPASISARIQALGHYQPAKVVTNADLIASGVDTDDEWIRTRVGITERRYAENESVVDMAEAAARMALANSALSPADIDLVICTTCTQWFQVPNAAPEIAHRLGIKAPGAYDLNGACAGFVYGLATAASAIAARQARNVLLVASERVTDWIDLNDRSNCILFGDAAGCAIITASDQPAVGPIAWGSAGDHAKTISTDRDSHAFVQDGQTVYRWAVSTMAEVSRRACELAGVEPQEIAAFVPHQANLRIIDAIAKRLGMTGAAIARDIVTSGNTSSASIPLALSKMVAQGQVNTGDPVLIIGFGAGLTYAGQVVLAP